MATNSFPTIRQTIQPKKPFNAAGNSINGLTCVERCATFQTALSKRKSSRISYEAHPPLAPYLIVVFKKVYDLLPSGEKRTNYYVAESVGIACGFLLAAIHQAGFVGLTHTPSPMNFLSKILDRPENERPFLLIPVGYPTQETFVPNIKRKELDKVVQFYDAKS